MMLTKKHKLVPKQWMHNYNTTNINRKTLKDLMKENEMPIP